MRQLLIIALLICFSCKKEKQINANLEDSVTKQTVKVDTIYCDYQKKDAVKRDTISLYNKSYLSVVKTHSLLDDKIINSSENQVNICYHKASNIVLLKEKDTIFTKTIDVALLNKEYTLFYKRFIKSELGTQDGMSIIEPKQNLRLDSVRLSGARENFIYYTSYLKNYKSSKKYKIEIGIGYLDEKLGEYSINQLEELE